MQSHFYLWDNFVYQYISITFCTIILYLFHQPSVGRLFHFFLCNVVVMNFPVFLYACVIVCHRMHFEQWDDSCKEDIKFCTLKDSTKVFSKNDTHKMCLSLLQHVLDNSGHYKIFFSTCQHEIYMFIYTCKDRYVLYLYTHRCFYLSIHHSTASGALA